MLLVDIAIMLTYLSLINSQGVEYVLPLSLTPTANQDVYETTGKLLFTITLPQRTVGDLISPGTGSCSSPDTASGSWCPLHFHVQQLASSLHSSITPDNLRPKLSPTPIQVATEEELCDQVNSVHFKSLFSLQPDVERYRILASSCGDRVVSSTLNDPFPQDVNFLYRLAWTNYTSTYWTEPRDPWKNAAHGIASSTLTGIGFLNYLAEEQIWSDAIAKCQQGLIPISLISEVDFQTQLHQLDLKVSGTYQLTIPITEVSKYFSLPYSECTFYQEGTRPQLLVSVKIPMRRSASDWRVNRVQVIPFRHIFEGIPYICHVPEFGDADSVVLHNSATYRTDRKYFFVSHQSLIHASSQARGSWTKSCLQYVLEYREADDFQNMLDACLLDCRREEDFNLPLMLKAGRDSNVIVAGNPTTSLTIRCAVGQPEFHYPPERGALAVKIPCGCRLVVGGDEIAADAMDCSTGLQVKIVNAINLSRNSFRVVK